MKLIGTAVSMYYGIGSALTVAGAGFPGSLAADHSGERDEDTDAIIKSLVDVMLKIFFYIGIVLLVWSIGMLILAFKNEDADSKSRAIMLLVVSVSLIGLRFLVSAVLGSVGFSI